VGAGYFEPREKDEIGDCFPRIKSRVRQAAPAGRRAAGYYLSLFQEGLAAAGKEMGARVDALLLDYGLCGNALAEPAALLAESGVPAFIPWDEEHPVDDCVGLIIGLRENYYEG
jgi:hypothetical protein